MSFVRLAVALVLSLPIAWNRDGRSRSAGLRTYPLVAAGTCGLVLIGGSALGPSAEEQADVVFGILTGIGFIGSGVLLEGPEGNRGMATMVSLWVTVAIGLAAAYGLYLLALAVSMLSVAALNLTLPGESGSTR